MNSSAEAIPNEKAEAVASSIDITPAPTRRTPPELPIWRYSLITLALSIGLFLALLDSTIVATAIYTISLEFGSLTTSFWVALAYTLGELSFATVFARASDFTGRQPAVLVSLLIFLGASLGAAWSPNINALIACRAIQGLGGAGLYALGIVVLVEITPDRRKPMISGVIGVIIAAAGAVGPLVGGAFTSYVTWRWIFWMNGPLSLTAIILFKLSWPKGLDDPTERRPFREFDWLGTLLLIAASCLVVFGLQRGAGGTAAWHSAEVICALVFGCLSWILLFVWEFLICKTSIAAAFPVLVLERRRMFTAVCCTLFAGFSSFAAIYFIPLRYQLVNRASPSEAGVRLLPLLCSSAVFSVVSGMINRLHNRCTYTFMAAAAFTSLGAGLMTTLPTALEVPICEYGFQVLFGAGAGLTYSTISMLVSYETEQKDSAVVQGVAAQMRILGGSIGIAAGNGLLHRQLGISLAGALPAELVAAVQNSSEAVAMLTPQQAELVRTAYALAFSETMRVCIYVGAVGFVAAVLTWQRKPPHPIGDRLRKEKEEASKGNA